MQRSFETSFQPLTLSVWTKLCKNKAKQTILALNLTFDWRDFTTRFNWLPV